MEKHKAAGVKSSEPQLQPWHPREEGTQGKPGSPGVPDGNPSHRIPLFPSLKSRASICLVRQASIGEVPGSVSRRLRTLEPGTRLRGSSAGNSHSGGLEASIAESGWEMAMGASQGAMV